MRSLTAFLFILLLSGCMYSVHQFSSSDVSAPRKSESMKRIVAESQQFVILGFAKNTDYADEALSKLINLCPTGTIQSIGTRFSTDLGFLSWTNRIRLEGYCVE